MIAFYLPQFHPIPENDAWWGRGFTEWTNTARARGLFPGHRQPHLPADLGFYDLRLPETQERQAELATSYGIEAFCYWHYWFAGRQILNRPLDQMLATPSIRMGFCMGWANQTWSGIWHGAPDRTLIEQTYPGTADYEAHFMHILPALIDSRYFTVDERPLFYVFRPELLPSPAAFVDQWQHLARKAGFPGLYLVAEISDLLGRGPSYESLQKDGFDAGVYVRLPASATPTAVLRSRVERKVLHWPERYRYTQNLPEPSREIPGTVLPCVYPNWDNTPRSGRRGLVITGSTPERFGAHVAGAVTRVRSLPPERRLLFVKSWNEWAEGNYLEPDLDSGHSFLVALKKGLGVGS